MSSVKDRLNEAAALPEPPWWLDEPVRSSRLWYSGGGWDVPWCKWVMAGGDENCNRTVCVKVPGGALVLSLNVPLRQKPCAECLADELRYADALWAVSRTPKGNP